MQNSEQEIVGTSFEDAGVRLEAADNEDAWIEVDYREGWWKRKLMTEDSTAYEEMVEPYFLHCQACGTYDSPQMWSAGCQFCPTCELKWDSIGGWFEQTENGELPKPTTCPECDSVDVALEVFSPSKCNECGTEFDRNTVEA